MIKVSYDETDPRIRDLYAGVGLTAENARKRDRPLMSLRHAVRIWLYDNVFDSAIAVARAETCALGLEGLNHSSIDNSVSRRGKARHSRDVIHMLCEYVQPVAARLFHSQDDAARSGKAMVPPVLRSHDAEEIQRRIELMTAMPEATDGDIVELDIILTSIQYQGYLTKHRYYRLQEIYRRLHGIPY